MNRGRAVLHGPAFLGPAKAGPACFGRSVGHDGMAGTGVCAVPVSGGAAGAACASPGTWGAAPELSGGGAGVRPARPPGRVEQALNRPGECRAVADPVRGTVRVYCRRPTDGREIRRVLTEQGCSVHALTGV